MNLFVSSHLNGLVLSDLKGLKQEVSKEMYIESATLKLELMERKQFDSKTNSMLNHIRECARMCSRLIARKEQLPTVPFLHYPFLSSRFF